MPHRIYLKSTEAVVDQVGYTRIDSASILAVDRLSDGSLAHNVYTRLGDQVYEDTHAVDLDDAVNTFKEVSKSLMDLQIALGYCDLDSPVPARAKAYMPDYTEKSAKTEPEVRDLGGRVFPGHFRWYVLISAKPLEGFPIAGFESFYEACKFCAELEDYDQGLNLGEVHYVVEV